jgi:hypothetical protein
MLANFTRVETFGARQTRWVSATINPHDPNLVRVRAAHRPGQRRLGIRQMAVRPTAGPPSGSVRTATKSACRSDHPTPPGPQSQGFPHRQPSGDPTLTPALERPELLHSASHQRQSRRLESKRVGRLLECPLSPFARSLPSLRSPASRDRVGDRPAGRCPDVGIDARSRSQRVCDRSPALGGVHRSLGCDPARHRRVLAGAPPPGAGNTPIVREPTTSRERARP